MLNIRIKINFPLFRKENKKEVESIEFSETRNYMNKLKNEGEISKYYNKLEESYEKFINTLDEVKKTFEDLENRNEKKFAPLVRRNLKKIKKLDEFNVSSFQGFYIDTFYTIGRIVKIPVRVQHEALNYENGKEAISLLNSLFKELHNLKKILAKRYSEYSIINHFEKASKKHEEIQEFIKKTEDLEKKIGPVLKEEKNIKKSLEEKKKNLQDLEPKTENEKIMELKKQISSLDTEIKTIEYDLKISLLNGRRQISKVLHSEEDKKFFEFFQDFIKSPLENVNENFWKMVSKLKKIPKINEEGNENINEFLKFVENELNDKILEYKKLGNEKKKLEDTFEELSSKDREIFRKFEKEKYDAEKRFKIIQKKLNDLEKEKKRLEAGIRENIKILEIMLNKISNVEIKVIIS